MYVSILLVTRKKLHSYWQNQGGFCVFENQGVHNYKTRPWFLTFSWHYFLYYLFNFEANQYFL